MSQTVAKRKRRQAKLDPRFLSKTRRAESRSNRYARALANLKAMQQRGKK